MTGPEENIANVTASARGDRFTLAFSSLTNMDPLSILGTITGLISLAQSLIPPLMLFVDDVRSYSKEFAKLNAEVRGLYGILCGLHSMIDSPRIQNGEGKGSYSKFISLTSRRYRSFACTT
jgi:hypothetical protein